MINMMQNGLQNIPNSSISKISPDLVLPIDKDTLCKGKDKTNTNINDVLANEMISEITDQIPTKDKLKTINLDTINFNEFAFTS